MKIPTAHIDPFQQRCQVSQTPGDQVPYFAHRLPAPVDFQQPRTDQGLTLTLSQVAPDDHIEVAELILQSDKGDATGGAWACRPVTKPATLTLRPCATAINSTELRQRRLRSSSRNNANGCGPRVVPSVA